MSNIYNFQQVSANSRIVAIEGTFDHIDVNNVNIANMHTTILNVDTIEENTLNNHVQIKRMVTPEPLEEIQVYFNTVTTTGLKTTATNWGIDISGDVASGYMPSVDIVTGLFTVQENGIYCTSLKTTWNSVNISENETLYYKCINITNNERNGVEVAFAPGQHTGIGEIPEANQSQITFMNAGDILQIEYYSVGGVNSPIFDLQFQIIRIK